MQLDIPEKNIRVIDHGDSMDFDGVNIRGVFALGTAPNVLDTTGYAITFANGQSVYHTSDTAFCDLLLAACPTVDVLLPCINGKFGNLNIAQAVALTKAVKPRYVIPNHYDVMALNSENPESFKYFCHSEGVEAECVILNMMGMFTW
jgi:L-ascorbate 6-phosphate lactonase